MALASGTLAGTVGAQATFEVVGPSGVSQLTPDGTTVADNDGASSWPWTQMGGFVQLGAATAVTLFDDAPAAAGSRSGTTGFGGPALWDASLSETLFLVRNSNPTGVGEINWINGDGSTIAGQDLDSGFVWTQSVGLEVFGPLPGVDPNLNDNFSPAATEDGSRAVGGNAGFRITSQISVGSGALMNSNGDVPVSSNSFELSAGCLLPATTWHFQAW